MTQHELTPVPVALGTWAWGDTGRPGDGYFGSELATDQLREVAAKAHSAGFTLWDTAYNYGKGRSESTLQQVLSDYDRDDYQLSTKFTPGAAGDGTDPMGDMLELSLANLATDHIDLYWIHNSEDVDRWTAALIPLLRSGRIRHVGVSNHNLRQIEQADAILREAGYRVEAVQNHFSLLHRESEEAGILDYCQDNDITFFPYMVLEQGALTGAYSPEHPMPEGSSRAEIYNPMLERLAPVTSRLSELGSAKGAGTADVATAWAIAKGTTPIIGVTKPAHVESLVRAAALELSAEEVSSLEELSAGVRVNTRGFWEKSI